MWKRKPRTTLAQDLYDTAGNLQTVVRQLMELSLELSEDGNERAAQATTWMILTLQEREAGLRKHADRLTKTGNLGRRASDAVTGTNPPRKPLAKPRLIDDAGRLD
ncbi:MULTISPECIES: hypothetical protein [unclassified Pseudomonas]|uniref:hypothetical protein n=1 Tax=unclassified Pseudomonas TaxID=196821 RepID=UPI0025FFC1DD|nr:MULTISPECIES: hypothetical protein [unclassified Pseudomonas]